VFGPEAVTTGASNDIEHATELARNMVTKWGLSERLGTQTYAEEEGEVFLGRSVTQHKQVGDKTRDAIDDEIKRLIDDNKKRAHDILTTHLDQLHTMADALIRWETIGEQQINDIMNGRPPKPPEGWEEPVPPAPRDQEPGDVKAKPAVGPPASQH
jgi:cell division protease FtsH